MLSPALAANRTHMRVLASSDGGKSWPSSQLIWAGAAGYAILTTSDQGPNTVGVLFENDDSSIFDRGEGDPVSRISFENVKVAPL